MRLKPFFEKFIPPFLVSCYHFLLAFFGAVLYRFPSKKLKVIGVTGTKGKTAVVEMAGKILEEAGYKVASISSIKFKIGPEKWKNDLKMTMPGRFKLQRFLRRAVNAGCQYAILEVTSEGILQHRHRFVDFEVAVFTNLSPEHIERHGSFEKYREAKGKLFQSCKNIQILNLDDENIKFFSKFFSREKIFFTLHPPSDHISLLLRSSRLISQRLVRGEELALGESDFSSGISFFTRFRIEDTIFNLNLLGSFNIYNALAAICIGLSQGVSLETSKKALEKIKGIPGRMEIVISEPFKVIVDYAHTPDSLEKVYQTVKNSKSEIRNPKMICVLGACGGGRDKWKRPKMGEIAAKYCDKIILTNEDPYDEDPKEIINQIARGITTIQRSLNSYYPFGILNRGEAIKKALSLAGLGDIVVITGKGSEPWMCVEKGKKIPWDDRQVVREQLRELKIQN